MGLFLSKNKCWKKNDAFLKKPWRQTFFFQFKAACFSRILSVVLILMKEDKKKDFQYRLNVIIKNVYDKIEIFVSKYIKMVR